RRWLWQPHILLTARAQFEAMLLEIAEFAEEWLTSAESMGLANRTGDVRVLPWDRTTPVPGRAERAELAGARQRPTTPNRTGGSPRYARAARQRQQEV